MTDIDAPIWSKQNDFLICVIKSLKTYIYLFFMTIQLLLSFDERWMYYVTGNLINCSNFVCDDVLNESSVMETLMEGLCVQTLSVEAVLVFICGTVA